jgi:putative transcriptional regulator
MARKKVRPPAYKIRQAPAVVSLPVQLDELLALAIDPVAPPPALRDRLLVSTRSGRPLPSFAGGVARLFDVPVAHARTELEGIEWLPSPFPGFQVDASARFLRGAPGARFPRHRHLGREEVLVLQGGFQDDRGAVWAGQLATNDPGSEHAFVVLAGCDCIAAVLSRGFELC